MMLGSMIAPTRQVGRATARAWRKLTTLRDAVFKDGKRIKPGTIYTIPFTGCGPGKKHTMIFEGAESALESLQQDLIW
jgi:hypothetical protein